MMSNQYNELKKKIPELTIERHQVLFQSKTKHERFLLLTNIYILHYITFQKEDGHCHFGVRRFVGVCF